MKRLLPLLLAGSVLAGIPAVAQNNAPTINYDGDVNFLKTPNDVYLGEVGGVARIPVATSSSTPVQVIPS
jgi:hypothetical protein